MPVLLFRKVSKCVNGLCERAASIGTFLFLKSSRGCVCVCVCEHVVLDMSHFLPHNCSESQFPLGNTVCLHPHPLPPSRPSPHVLSCGVLEHVSSCAWRGMEAGGVARLMPQGLALSCSASRGKKRPEKRVNSCYFLHVFMNADVCAFQSCDCPGHLDVVVLVQT